MPSLELSAPLSLQELQDEALISPVPLQEQLLIIIGGVACRMWEYEDLIEPDE